MEYQNFKKEYDQSGLTQKEFSLRKGISASMVSYYLRKAREENQTPEQMQHNSAKIFRELQIVSESHKVVRITYPSGMQIDLPI